MKNRMRYVALLLSLLLTTGSVAGSVFASETGTANEVFTGIDCEVIESEESKETLSLDACNEDDSPAEDVEDEKDLNSADATEEAGVEEKIETSEDINIPEIAELEKETESSEDVNVSEKGNQTEDAGKTEETESFERINDEDRREADEHAPTEEPGVADGIQIERNNDSDTSDSGGIVASIDEDSDKEVGDEDNAITTDGEVKNDLELLEEDLNTPSMFATSNHTSQNAMSISTNSYYSDSLTRSGLANWYKFILYSPGYVDFSFSHDFVNSSSTYWELHLYGQDDLNNEMLWRGYKGNELNEVRSYGTGLPAGTYYIEIDDYYFSSVSYRLKVNYTQSYYYEREKNDSVVNATGINVNKVYNGNLMSSSDEDWYSFTLDSPGYIGTSFSHGFINSSSTYWGLYLYSKNNLNSSIFDKWYEGNELNEVTDYGTGLPAGTYYIKITDYYSSDVNYSFKINYSVSSNWEREENDSSSSANIITPGSYCNGNLTRSDDEDWYKFTVDSFQYMYISFSHKFVDSSSTNWTLRLYNSYDLNSDILNEWIAGNKYFYESDVSKNYIYLDPGTYYIKIEKYYYSNVPYTLSIARIKMNQNISVSSIGNLVVGNTATLFVVGNHGALSFKSGNTSVATVGSTNGRITAKSPGLAKITVTAAETSDYKKEIRTITVKVFPKPTSIYSLTKNANGFTVKWNKISGITGYQIQYSIRSNFLSDKIVTVASATATSKVISGLTHGKSYYVRMRSYKKTGGRTYCSGWCTKKKVKI